MIPSVVYVSHKVVSAKPMSRQEYNDFRGWTVPSDEDSQDKGYLVEYLDGGKPNHPEFVGYISWSPESVFEQGHRVSGVLTFGDAIESLKAGHKVARASWNSCGVYGKWLSLTPGQFVNAAKLWSPHNHQFALENGGQVEVESYITVKTTQGKIVPWLPSQSDVLANNWIICND